jgi:hypothetical protein
MGPMLPDLSFRKCEARSKVWNGKTTMDWRQVSVPEFRKSTPRERKFITATKIRRWRDIAVMAQFQRNVGNHVALGAGEA